MPEPERQLLNASRWASYLVQAADLVVIVCCVRPGFPNCHHGSRLCLCGVLGEVHELLNWALQGWERV